MNEIESISKQLSDAGVFLLRQAFVAHRAAKANMDTSFFQSLAVKSKDVLQYGLKHKFALDRDADLVILTEWLQAMHKQAKTEKWSESEFSSKINAFFENQLDQATLRILIKSNSSNSSTNSEADNNGVIQNLKTAFGLSSGRMMAIRRDFNGEDNTGHVHLLERVFSPQDETEFWSFATCEIEKIMSATVESKTAIIQERKS